MDMSGNFDVRRTTRRELLQGATAIVGGALLSPMFSGTLARAAWLGFSQQAAAQATNPVDAFRAQMASNPIQAQKLSDTLTLLSGPGGNIVVSNGTDGTIIVDTFVLPAWAKLKETLDGMGAAPLKFVINTHWHFDHTSTNAAL